MPTTILDGETYEQARHRRFTEEAKAIEKMQQDEIIRMARELATRHGIRMCDEDGDTHGEELYCVGIDDIAEIIKQANKPQVCCQDFEKCDNWRCAPKAIAYEREAIMEIVNTIGGKFAVECAAALRARSTKE